MFKSSLNVFKTLKLNNFINRTFSTNYQNVKIIKDHPGIAIIQLNRPKAKNALNSDLISELNHALAEHEKDKDIGCHIVYGDEGYFAAGADIKAMKDLDYSFVYENHFLDDFGFIAKIK